MMICGIISAALIGLYIEKTLKYNKMFKIIGILALIDCVGFPLVVSLLEHNFPLAILLTAVMGVVFIPFMPLTFDYSCDILFPAGEAQITGCLMTSGNLMGAILVRIEIFRF